MKTVIYSKYSNERNYHLAIRTDILEDETGKRYVQKVSEFPEGQLHIAALYHWYQAFSRLCEGTKLCYNRCEIVQGGVELEYLTGETLEEHLLKVEREKGIDACAEEFLEYLNFIREFHTGAVFEPTMEFREVFGEIPLKTGTVCAPFSNIDLVCANILLTGDSWTAIDYEWCFDFPIPVGYILYRTIFYFVDHAGREKEFRKYRFLEKMGITEEDEKAYILMEKNLQRYVSRDHVPIRDLYEDISDGTYKVEETILQETLQVFFDYGEGFSEENSMTLPLKHRKICTQIVLPEKVKGLRVDPGSVAGMVKLKEFRFDNQQKRVAFTLRDGAVVENWIYVGDNDPNILLTELPEGAKALLVDLEVYPIEEIPMEEMTKLAKEFVRQKEKMREMQNTKVWKLYRKYRSRRDK